MTNLVNLREVTCFENEGEGDDVAATAAAAAKAAEEQKQADKTFNQDQVNEIVGKRNKALQEKYQALEGTYTELLEQTNLSEGARTKLQQELANVQKEMRTKEQQIEFERKQAQSKFEADLRGASEERDYYKNLFETTTTQREIKDAALSLEGFNGDDFIAHLGPRSSVVDEIDAEGQPTGRKITQIDWEVKDEKSGVSGPTSSSRT
jgi:hypothetical protein